MVSTSALKPPEGFVVRTPQTEEEMKKYYQLRYETLRRPWGQPPGSEQDPSDANAIHAFVLHGDRVTAVSRLHFNDPAEGQIRYMGVDESYRRRGLGALLLDYLEDIARKRGARRMILHARETAIPFYLSCGYSIHEKSYLLFGEIQHYSMVRDL